MFRIFRMFVEPFIRLFQLVQKSSMARVIVHLVFGDLSSQDDEMVDLYFRHYYFNNCYYHKGDRRTTSSAAGTPRFGYTMSTRWWGSEL